MHRLFEHYFSATADGPKTAAGDNFYLVNLSTWFLTGLVRRAILPGCVNQYVVIVSGDQGLRKSSGLRALVGEQWFSDRMPAMRLKDQDPKRFYDMLRGHWLIEIGEGKAIKGTDPDGLKEFLTQAIDEFKPAYAADQIVMPRSFVFVVTRNPVEGEGFLLDMTGNRRFWPIDCGPVRVEEIKRDREQLIAEALDHIRFAERYECGDAPFYPDEAFEIEYLKPLQAELVKLSGFDEIAAEFLETHPEIDRVKPIRIAREFMGGFVAKPNDLKEIGAALARTGKWRRAKSVNGGYVRIDAPGADDPIIPF